jgi:hypothetical protein
MYCSRKAFVELDGQILMKALRELKKLSAYEHLNPPI